MASVNRHFMLFTIPTPVDSSPKRNGESSFAFLERSARPEIARVRELLTDLLREYPDFEREEAIARIRSGDNTAFASATFELLLYGYFRRLGFSVEPHPEIPGTTKRPDFRVTSSSGESFYLEAVLTSEDKSTRPAALSRIGTTLDALAKVSHPNFYVSIEYEGEPTTQPSGVQLRKAVVKWLDTLKPDEVAKAYSEGGFEATPSTVWTHESWELTLRPIPIAPHKRGKATTLIGAQGGGAGFVDAWTPIRDAVRFKGSRYGDLGAPFIVAVNMDQFHLERIDEMQALYGEEQFIFGPEATEPRMERAPNGAWYGPAGPRSRRVSGACVFNDLTPYTLATRRHTLYFNPWALWPLPALLQMLPHARPKESKMRWFEGPSIKNVFGLPDDWPE